MCTFVCDWVVFLDMGIRTLSETTFAQSKVYRKKWRWILLVKGKGQTRGWVFSLHLMAFTVAGSLCCSHCVSLVTSLGYLGVYGVLRLSYAIMVVLAQRLRCSRCCSTKIFTFFFFFVTPFFCWCSCCDCCCATPRGNFGNSRPWVINVSCELTVSAPVWWTRAKTSGRPYDWA